MAELKNPKYQVGREIYSSRPGTNQALGQSNVIDNMTNTNNVFDQLINSLDVYQSIFHKSQQTANRLQANDLINQKTKHHNNLKNELAVHLPQTAPQHLALKDVIKKLGTRDGQGRSDLNIGTNLDINISPMLLDDTLPDEIKSLVENHFISLDQDLISSVLGGVEVAQSNYDKHLMNVESRNARSKMKQAFAFGTTRFDGANRAKEILGVQIANIQKRAIEGGTLDEYEIQIETDKAIQGYLEELFLRDMADPAMSRETVIKNAERSVYKDKFNGQDHFLSTTFYQQYITKRNERTENERIRNEEKSEQEQIALNFDAYKERMKDLIKEKGFGVFDRSVVLSELADMKVNVKDALAWINTKTQQNKTSEQYNLEQDLIANLAFDSGLLYKLTDFAKDSKGKAIKDKDGNLKLIPKNKPELKNAIARLYGDKYEKAHSLIDEGFISQLIKGELLQTRRDKEIKLNRSQQSYIHSLSVDAMGVHGAGDVIDLFGHVTDKGEIVINGGKIAAHGGLRELWGEGNQSQKISAIAPILASAIRTHNQHLKKMKGDQIGDGHSAVLGSIEREYYTNLQVRMPLALNKQKLPIWEPSRQGNNKSRTSAQLVKESAIEQRLMGLRQIGENIVNRSYTQLENDLEIIKKDYSDSVYTNNIKGMVENAIIARRKNLLAETAHLALKETNQLEAYNNGQEINVDELYKWHKQYGVGGKQVLIPNNDLKEISILTDQEANAEKKFDTFIKLYTKTSQFGNQKQVHEHARWQLRQAIKGGGRHGSKTGTPALAALVDIWDDMDQLKQREIFDIASGKYSSLEAMKNRDPDKGNTAWSKVKAIINKRHKHHGVKSTMQSPTQRDDLSVLEELIVKVRGSGGYYDDDKFQDPEEIARSLHDDLFPDIWVLDTGQRLNVQVNKNWFKQYGMDWDEGSRIAQAHIINNLEGTWGLLPNLTGQLSKETLVQDMKRKLLSVQLPQNVTRYQREDGVIMEKTKNADGSFTEKEIQSDLFNKLRLKTDLQITEDIMAGESENMKIGLINKDDGFHIGVYLIPDGGTENQGQLIGVFLEEVNGKTQPKFINQQQFMKSAASPYVVRYLSEPQYNVTDLHQHVIDLYTEGADKAISGELKARKSTIPFLRFLDSFGKLEFKHAIEPLYAKMQQKAKELGVDRLSHSQARELVNELKNEQVRWYNNEKIPQVFKKQFQFISNWFSIPG